LLKTDEQTMEKEFLIKKVYRRDEVARLRCHFRFGLKRVKFKALTPFFIIITLVIIITRFEKLLSNFSINT